MSIRRTALAIASISGLVLLAGCGSDDDQSDAEDLEIGDEEDFVDTLTFGTAGTTGVYYPLAGEYAQIWEENIDDLTVETITSDASVANIGGISQEDMQLGLAQSDTFAMAIRGDGDFEDADVSNVGWVAGLYPEAMHLIVADSAGIESIEDLEGKSVAVGAPGSGTRAISDAILEAHGIEEGDYTPYEEEFNDSASLMQDGNIDASLFTVGTPNAAVDQLAAGTDISLLGIDPDVIDELTEDTDFDEFTMESDAYDFMEEDVTTISVTAALFASTTQVSEDMVYEMTELIFEESDRITLPQGEMIGHDNALLGLADGPMHPGAERYYEENDVEEP
ncbi:MAG: TAXI family TRAP transporter solute-binding subunit [Nesterenkonia sp.]|uniref:TAXI family TRAP transporter solute-binding subunit n=1 Tax=Nesterenkonia marinintestina TaxID=2979865 RepID=UPI0021BE8334|nr:TAXI family TRAP transporter solute-binding subunit [Nesterenkonia sp. GX14115]MDO5492533.1 TAXI family TRAP transporter solute-binding subunit [Nesterenkonia sp.]